MGLRAALFNLTYDWPRRVKRVRLHIFAFIVFILGLLELVDPYAVYQFIPERWQGIFPVGFAILLWLMRKVAEHPPVITTTAYGEMYATTEPHEEPVQATMSGTVASLAEPKA